MERYKTSWTELVTELLIRLSVVWLLVLTYLILPNGEMAFYAGMTFAFVAAVPFSLWMKRRRHPPRHAALLFIMDIVLVAGLVYVTGGIHSHLALLYPLVILSVGIVSTPRQTAEITTLAIILYTLTITLRGQDLAVDYLSGGETAAPPSIMATILVRIFVFALFGAAGVYVSRYCSIRKISESGMERPLNRLLNSIQAGILLLQQDGRIIQANDAACALLSRSKESLVGSLFTDLHATQSDEIPPEYRPGACFLRPDRNPIPMSCRKTDIFLSASELVNSTDSRDADVQISVVVLNDLSGVLQLQQELEKVDRITTATQIAGEMAHEIRTPLTAISASVQLLKHFEQNTTAADWLPNSPRKKDRTELFEHILGATERMDTVIQNFCDFAEFSPADLLSIIRLDSTAEKKGYMCQFKEKVRGFSNGQDPDCGRRPDHTEFAE